MLAARLLVAALNGGIVGIQKKNIVVDLLFIKVGQRLLQFFNAAHAAHVHDDGNAVQLVSPAGEVHDTRQQRHRDVVNAEKADVLQRIDSH